MYSTIVLYSRDHKGLGMTHGETSPMEKHHPWRNITLKPTLLLPDNDEAVLVRPKQAFRLIQTAFNNLLWNLNILSEFSTE